MADKPEYIHKPEYILRGVSLKPLFEKEIDFKNIYSPSIIIDESLGESIYENLDDDIKNEINELWAYVLIEKSILIKTKIKNIKNINEALLMSGLSLDWLLSFSENHYKNFKANYELELKNIKDKVEIQDEIKKLSTKTKTDSEFNLLGANITYELKNFGSDFHDIFNSISLNSYVLMCSYKQYYKVNSEIKNVKLSPTFTRILEKRYKPNLEPIYIVVNKSAFLKEQRTFIDIKQKVRKINWEKESVYIKLQKVRKREIDGKMNFIVTMNVDIFNDMSESKVIDFFKSLFDSEKIKDVDIMRKNTLEKGVFYFFDKNISNTVLSHVITNDKVYKTFMDIFERQKSLKTRDNLYVYFKHPVSGKIATFSILNKNKDTPDPELNSFKTEKITSFLAKGKGKYIRVYVTKITEDEKTYFINLLTSLINKCTDTKTKDSINKIYKKYVDVEEEEDEEEEDEKDEGKTEKVRSSNKIFMKDILPRIYGSGYTRICQSKVQPVIVDTDEKRKEVKKFAKNLGLEYKDITISKFPKDGEGDPLDQREYACLHEDFPYPGFKINEPEKFNSHPVVPCCYAKPQTEKKTYTDYYSNKDIEKKEGRGSTQLDLKTAKFVDYGGFGTLDSIPLINKMFENIDPEYIYKRTGVSNTKSTLLECIYTSLPELRASYKGMDRKKKTEELRQDLRKLIISQPSLLVFCKQTMYDKTDEEIIDYISDPNQYLDPKLVIPLFEKLYKTNIYLFTLVNGEVDLANTVSEKGFVKYNEVYDRSVFVYENRGSESDKSSYMRCEIICKMNKYLLNNDQTLRLHHINFPSLYKFTKTAKTRCLGDLDPLFFKQNNYGFSKLDVSKLNLTKLIFVFDEKTKVYTFLCFRDKDDKAHILKNGKLVEQKLQLDSLYEVKLEGEKTLKNIIYFENDVFYIEDSSSVSYGVENVEGMFKFRNIYINKYTINYGPKTSGIIADSVKKILTTNYTPQSQYVDMYGKMRYVLLKNKQNGKLISIFTDPLPPLDIEGVAVPEIKDFTDFQVEENKTETDNFISLNNLYIKSKKLDLAGSITEIEIEINKGLSFYIPYKSPDTGIFEKVKVSTKMSQTLTGKRGELDNTEILKETALFLKEYYIYLFSVWFKDKKDKKDKKIDFTEKAKEWIRGSIELREGYEYKFEDANPTKFKDAYDSNLFLTPSKKLILSSLKLGEKLIYNFMLNLMLNKDRVINYHSKVDVRKKKIDYFIEIPDKDSHIIVQGLPKLIDYFEGSFIRDDKNMFYDSYIPKMKTPYNLLINNKFYLCMNAPSLKSAIWLCDQINEDETFIEKFYNMKDSDYEEYKKVKNCNLYFIKEIGNKKIMNMHVFKPEPSKQTDFSHRNILTYMHDSTPRYSILIYIKDVKYKREERREERAFKLEEVKEVKEEKEEKKQKKSVKISVKMNKEKEFDKDQYNEEKLELIKGKNLVEENKLQPIDFKPPLLKNVGNSCFMNSTLQLLYSIPELREMFEKLDIKQLLISSEMKSQSDCNELGIETTLPLIITLKNIFNTFKKSNGKKKIDLEDLELEVGNKNKSYYDILLEVGKIFPGEQTDVAQSFLYPLISKFICFNQTLSLINKFYYFEQNTFICKDDEGKELNRVSDQKYETDNFSHIGESKSKNNITLELVEGAETIQDLIQSNQYSEVKVESNRCNSVVGTKYVLKKTEYKNYKDTEYYMITLNRGGYDEEKGYYKNRQSIKPNKVIEVDGTKFGLYGCIVHISHDSDKHKGVPEVESGHYVYVQFSNGDPVYTMDDDEMDVSMDYPKKIKKDGYVFLYKKL